MFKKNGEGKVKVDFIGAVNLTIQFVVFLIIIMVFFFKTTGPMQTMIALHEQRICAMERIVKQHHTTLSELIKAEAKRQGAEGAIRLKP